MITLNINKDEIVIFNYYQTWAIQYYLLQFYAINNFLFNDDHNQSVF